MKPRAIKAMSPVLVLLLAVISGKAIIESISMQGKMESHDLWNFCLAFWGIGMIAWWVRLSLKKPAAPISSPEFDVWSKKTTSMLIAAALSGFALWLTSPYLH